MSNPTPTPVGQQQPRAKSAPFWRRLLADVVRFALPLTLSVLLIIWLLHKVDLQEVKQVIRHGCDFRWVALMMFITMLSHIARGVRWGIQLRAAGIPRMTVTAESVAIFGAYALNLVFPQLGEAWRCMYVSRRMHAPLTTVVGTDLGDRGSDAVVIMLLTGLALIVAHPAINDFFTHYRIGRDVDHLADDPLLWCGVVMVITVVWAVLHYCSRYSFVRSVDNGISKMWAGFRVLFTMKGRGLYLLLTLAIWGCYFLETYVMFNAFSFTRALITEPGSAFGLIPGLVVFVFGSLSMAVPSNGGLGPWNLAVMFALSLYGIDSAQGTAFSIVMWGCQAMMLVALGIFSAIYITVNKPPEAKAPK